MEIKIDSEKVQKAILNTLQKSIVECASSWPFQASITETVTEAFNKYGFFSELDKAIAKELEENMSVVAERVAKEVAKVSADAAISTIRDAVINTVYKLREPKYASTEEEKELRESIHDELFGKRGGKQNV